MQIFHNTKMTGLIHKTITKAAITKLYGLHHLQLVKKRHTSGQADKKVDILTFLHVKLLQQNMVKLFFPVVRQPCP